MKQATTLIDGSALASLLSKLEPNAEHLPEFRASKAFLAAFVVRSREDPGQRVLYLVAKSSPESRVDGSRWVAQHIREIEPSLSVEGAEIALCNVIVPGSWPEKTYRERRGTAVIRLVSAVQHLWADRLGIHDSAGELHTNQRMGLMQRLGGRWSSDEERQFTSPAISEVSGEEATDALRQLLQPHPDLRSGGVTVVYGPGGIGKTFFLRRVAHLMTRDAVGDPLQGIPVFAELPLLLHVDALETWLSHAGITLPIRQIRTMVAAGVIVPILDALDELVRGQAREGSREFLGHLRSTIEPHGKALLSSRDYYLNLDPLVQEELGITRSSHLSLGYFDKQGRRRYIQMRTRLSAEGAAKWANAIEEQAQQTLAGVAVTDVEALIGHPLFLDALSSWIVELPAGRRVAEASNFRLTSPDVFGEIVKRVLNREHDKALNGWSARFGQELVGVWADPFRLELQERVLRSLVLLTASDGAAEVTRREARDPGYRQLRHGVFTFTKGVPHDVESPRAALREIIRRELGDPDFRTEPKPEEREARISSALDEAAGFYLQHTLADTRPSLPADLVFATRHRAYFDYVLAEELLSKLRETLTAGSRGDSFDLVEWCLTHHIFERQGESEAPPFASSLDFALWHRQALDDARGLVASLFQPGGEDIVRSYVLSLGLALVLRAGLRSGSSTIRGQDFAAPDSSELEIVENVVPVIANVLIENCSFPRLRMRDVNVRSSRLLECDVAALVLTDCTWIGVEVNETACPAVELSGTCRFSNCQLDLIGFEESNLKLDQNATVSFRQCRLSQALLSALRTVAAVRPDIVELDNCSAIADSMQSAVGAGRLFIDRLMSLVRREGHREFGVFALKLRGLTRATGETFPQAISVLVGHGVIGVDGEIVYLTEAAEEHMYSGRGREGMRQYRDESAYWQPIVDELEAVLVREGAADAKG